MIIANGTGILPRVEIVATNASGSAMVKGGVYAIDLTRTAAGSTTVESAVANVVACATANLRGLLVVALAAHAAGAQGRFLLKGVEKILVDGTTDVAAGDRLIPQNASPNVIKQGTSTLVNPCAIALEAQTADAGTLATVFFNGETYQGERAAS